MKILEEIKVPQENINDEYITVISCFFKNGDYVNEKDELIELESSKTVFIIESKTSGYIEYFCKEGDEKAINEIIIKIYDSINEKIEIHSKSNISEDKINFIETIFSNKANDYISENKIDKSLFLNYDFINYQDIINILNPETKLEKKEILIEKNIKIEKHENTENRKISPSKKREIEYLSAVQGNNLISTVNCLINTKNIFYNINNNLKYFKDSLLPIIVFETSKLLAKYKEFNSYFFDNQIFNYNNINIGLAIDLEKGLKTAKIENTNTLSINEIENKIFELSNKYIDNKLESQDVNDITFTITDLSSTDIYFFTPLINKNNSAILGISAINSQKNEIILSLTFDHRVTEGKAASIFLKELKQRIESYAINKQQIEIKCFKCFKNIKEDFNNVGFLKTIIATGEEKYICQTCFNGF